MGGGASWSASVRRSTRHPIRTPRATPSRRLRRRAGRPAGDPPRPHRHRLPGGDGRAAAASRSTAGIATGPGVTDMKVGPPHAALRPARAARARRAAPLPFERLTVRRQPRRGDRLAGLDPAHRRVARERRRLQPRVRPGERRHRLVAQGDRRLRLTVHGRAAHAGVEPEKGRSAILAAAHLVIAPPRAERALARASPATSGSIDGGIRPNVVAERSGPRGRPAGGRPARRWRRPRRRSARSRRRRPCPTCRSTSSSGTPLADGEARARSGRLVEHARELAGGLGFEVRDAATGGASDANTTAGLGVPSLDGLGPIGGMDHSPEEWLDVDSIVPADRALRARSCSARRARPGRRRVGWRPRPGVSPGTGPPARVSSGGPWEASAGLQPGDRRRQDRAAWPGTTDAGPDGRSRHPGDPASPGRGRARHHRRALARGAASRWPTSSGPGCTSSSVGVPAGGADAHGAGFGDVRPAATLVVVAGLIDPSLLVEIEVEARGG